MSGEMIIVARTGTRTQTLSYVIGIQPKLKSAGNWISIKDCQLVAFTVKANLIDL